MAVLLQTDDVAPQSIVHTKKIGRPSNSVRLIHRYRPYVIRSNGDLPSTCTCSTPRFTLSQEAPLCSASPPPFACQECSPLRDFISYPPFPVPVLALYFGFSRPTPLRPAQLPSLERIWCFLPGFSPLSRSPRRYASFGVMTVGTNGLTCGFN